MAAHKVYELTKENLDLLQRSLGPDNPKESYTLRVLLEEQIRCHGEDHPVQSGTPLASMTLPTLSSSSVPTPDPDESLKPYKQMPTSGNDHPVERFLTPGATFEPLWFAKRELAALQMPYGDMTSLERRILLGKRNYSDIKPGSRERKRSS